MDDPKITTIPEKKMVGLKIRTSLAENKTFELWSRFMPKVKEVPNQKKSGIYSIQLFDEDLEFHQFTPKTFFEKWVAVEVFDFEEIPDELEPYVLPRGKYAVLFIMDRPIHFQKHLNIFLAAGFRTPLLKLITDLILRSWITNTSTTILMLKRRFGYPSGKTKIPRNLNSNYFSPYMDLRQSTIPVP